MKNWISAGIRSKNQSRELYFYHLQIWRKIVHLRGNFFESIPYWHIPEVTHFAKFFIPLFEKIFLEHVVYVGRLNIKFTTLLDFEKSSSSP